ncbi:PREDICTED: RCC1 and BTB domain-containing protein 1-like [Atta colombica]|uniref:RCC1 and BTB domain-containing protein 1-like n=1 Tax=Atta colombica TaxID=520822 RepID=UPI00084BD4E7|nr:PREDICTED: RCC1 and BTB domain-containing protein 1-like [Atta colombica]
MKEQSKRTSSGEPAPKTVKSSGKVATVFWDAYDIIHIDYLSSKQMINGDYYAILLDYFNNILKKKRPHLTKKKVLFHQDNAHKHVWQDTSAKPTFNSEIESTNKVENEIMVHYINVWIDGKNCSIYQIDIKEKITCMSCGNNFYVVVTDNYKTYIKVACGIDHTLALTDKGKVYGWGSNTYRQLNLNNRVDLILSPTKLNIDNVKKVSDIAVIDYKSFVKSSVGHIYTWGFIFNVPIKNLVVCECTNAFDICNSMIAHSPMSVACEFINEEFHILNDLETAFNDQSTSDLTIVIEKQTIYVHKAILKIRSIYFENMFRTNCIESKQSIIEIHYYRYVVYKTFLEYLYTGKINLSFFEDLLDLLQLADEVCLKNLQINCIETIKKTITVSNVIHLFNLVNKMVEHYRKELIKYCFNFYFKNMTKVIRTEGFQQLDAATKAMFIDKGRNFFSSRINRSSYLK